MNDFAPFSLADTLLNAERIKRLRMENEMLPEVRQQQLADRKMQNYQGVLQTASQVARNIQREMGKSGLTPDNPEFQQRLDQVSAPFRPIFDALHYEVTGNRAEQGPINWNGIVSLANTGLKPKVQSTIQEQLPGGAVRFGALDVEGNYAPIQNEAGQFVLGKPQGVPSGMTPEYGPRGELSFRASPRTLESSEALEAAKERGAQGEQVQTYTLPSGEEIPLRKGQAADIAERQLGLKEDIYTRMADAILPSLVQVESGGNPQAISSKGAEGLGQLMPGTKRNPGFGVAPVRDDSPEENLRMSRDYLAAMLRETGNVKEALSAYNQGIGNLQKKGIVNPEYVSAVEKAQPIRLGQTTREKQAAEEAAKTEAERERIPLKEQEQIAKETGEMKGKRMASAQTAMQSGNYMLELLKKAENHPGLPDVVGIPELLSLGGLAPGTPGRGFRGILDQIKGRTFLEAYEKLKGGGQISVEEGRKATDAMARLDNWQSEDDFKEALRELKSIVEIGVKNAQKAVSGDISPSNDVPEVNTGEKPVEQGRKPRGQFIGFE